MSRHKTRNTRIDTQVRDYFRDIESPIADLIIRKLEQSRRNIYRDAAIQSYAVYLRSVNLFGPMLAKKHAVSNYRHFVEYHSERRTYANPIKRIRDRKFR